LRRRVGGGRDGAAAVGCHHDEIEIALLAQMEQDFARAIPLRSTVVAR
jgi:hypothetical protein